MLRIRLIVTGNLKESYWRAAAAEYEKRLATMAKLEIIELKEYRLPENPSPAEIKTALEGLVGKIDGLVEMHILTERFPCSAGDVMMDSTFTDYAALEFYQKHPLHQAIANGLVRPAAAQRLSFDYET